MTRQRLARRCLKGQAALKLSRILSKSEVEVGEPFDAVRDRGD